MRLDADHSEPLCSAIVNDNSSLDIPTAVLLAWRSVASMSLSPSFPWPATRSPRHKKSCEAEPCTCWACCAPTLSCTTMSGACGRAARDGRGTRRQSSGQGQIQGYSDGRKKVVILVVRREKEAALRKSTSHPLMRAVHVCAPAVFRQIYRRLSGHRVR